MLRCIPYLLLLVCLQLHAQILPFKNYTTKDGLLSQSVSSITRDDKGILWIGTPFGINWYDGTQFTSPPIQARSGQLYITRFFKDKKGIIWTLTFYNGIYSYNGKHFNNFLPDNTTITSTANNVFDMLQYDDHRYLVATDHNVFWFDGKKFEAFIKDDSSLAIQFNSLAITADGMVLLGSPHGLFIYKLLKDKWTLQAKILEDHEINKIISDKNHTWMATDKGLLYFDDAAGLLTGLPQKKFAKGRNVSGINKNEATGEIWFCADKLFRLQKDSLKGFDAGNGLRSNPSTIYFDKENIAWLSTANGVIKLADQSYSYDNLLTTGIHQMINCMIEDDQQRLWLGTFDGLALKTGSGYKNFTSIGNKKIGYVSWLKHTKNNEWLAGSSNGIISIKNDRISFKNNLNTTKVLEDNDGVLWLGTEYGKLFTSRNGVITEMMLSHYLVDYIDAIYKDRTGKIWIGYRGSGIRVYTVNGNQLNLVKEFSMKTGFNDLRVRCAFADAEGNILFGTRTNGVFIFNSDGNLIRHLTTNNGLSANWVRWVTMDNGGNIYMATNKGVNILSGTYDKPVIKRMIAPNDEITDQTTFVYPAKHKIWIGTEQGILQYFPAKKPAFENPPPVYITHVSVNGIQDSSFTPYAVDLPVKHLPSTVNVISFEFAGINLKNDNAVEYRYFLKGQDHDWTYADSRNFVSYNLPAGQYTFLVEARTLPGNWSNKPASLHFIISTPFWKTWWFLSAIVITLFLLAVLFYQYRIRQALKLERLRSRISTDLHDDIGSTLSSISILSNIAANEKDQRQSTDMMQEIEQSSVLLMEKMDDIVWSINPHNDSMEQLMLRVKRFAARLFEAKGIDYDINIDESVNMARIDMENRQHIYLIMKEAINNLVKYADATEASIRVQYKQHYLYVEISDNGKGFNEQSVRMGNGILNMKKRAELIGAEINIRSIENSGTVVLFNVKIK